MSFYRAKIVTTRKAHVCDGCLQKLPQKSVMEYTSGVTDGDFWDAYYCLNCKMFLDVFWQEKIPVFKGDFKSPPLAAGGERYATLSTFSSLRSVLMEGGWDEK